MNTTALFIRLLADQILGRSSRARRQAHHDLGASAIEWAIISALVVTLAIIVFKMVRDAIVDKSGDIKQSP